MPWEPDELETAIRGLAERMEIGAGRVINPLRVALMGQGVSPGIFDVVAMMGPGRAAARLQVARGYLDAKAAMG